MAHQRSSREITKVTVLMPCLWEFFSNKNEGRVVDSMNYKNLADEKGINAVLK